MGLCNKNQLDALFILILFHQSTSACFWHICSPSSGCLKHVEVEWQNKLRINSASSWFYYTDVLRCMVNKHKKWLKKGKAVLLQAWSGPECSRKLRFPDFVTLAQDGGKVVSLTHRPPLPPRKYTWYSFLLEAESTPGQKMIYGCFKMWSFSYSGVEVLTEQILLGRILAVRLRSPC
jgi:hypothetical protein